MGQQRPIQWGSTSDCLGSGAVCWGKYPKRDEEAPSRPRASKDARAVSTYGKDRAGEEAANFVPSRRAR